MVPQLVISGLGMGCTYALIALGFVLIYSATGACNFAQGDIAMLGGFLAVWVVSAYGLGPVLGLLVSVLGMMLFGVIFQRLCYYPVRRRPPQYFIIASVGTGIALRAGALILWGPEPRAGARVFPTQYVNLGFGSVDSQYLFIGIVTVVILLSISFLFYRTKLGCMMRATAQDQEAAQLMGINVGRMIALTFMLSSVLAGVAGFLVAPVFFVSPDVGGPLILKAFVAVVIGGFGSAVGAVVGGLIVGLLEVFIAAFVSSAYKEVLTFILLILMLCFMPRGIFGESVAEKV